MGSGVKGPGRSLDHPSALMPRLRKSGVGFTCMSSWHGTGQLDLYLCTLYVVMLEEPREIPLLLICALRTFQFIEGQLHRTSVCSTYRYLFRSRGCAVGWGASLRAGRSRVWFPMRSFGFFIVLIFPASLLPSGRFRLRQNWVPAISPWG
jgi:hypothetical protein